MTDVAPLPLCSRLSLSIDTAPLLAALSRLPAEAWQPHFNTGYFSGDWSGIALIAPAGAHTALAPGDGEPQPTATFHAEPAWARVLAQIEAPIRAARLLRLGPGARIREHMDYDLAGPGSDMRVHIPLLSHPEVEFLLDGQLVPMQAGECWFLDLSRPHRVDNPTQHARIHLVLDCRRSLWLRQAVADGLPGTPPLGSSAGCRAFAAFQQQVAHDAALADALMAIETRDQFVAQAVALGAVHGHHFAPDDIHAAMRQGRQRWMQLWMA
ncbi:L-proline cis-4-hydroxylase [Andreprevotia sp. IGB-42]|uniref:aspartyl/asparaginyl beta-hydroxylase domain-containing protein n=1 Tax=Andreprevotia sp. IGB-42 TaxID=2497473 RepID=UPI00135C83E9|nr:aspartyl/asparaginyl beta-hydroxylase domain-containing protein [Andreprevotia sp. IGB-42]KAF0812482.1 L-proline cis-4-hydroxylase [Andreprevotia sp. IGB-42]